MLTLQQIVSSFGSSKTDLSLKYRLGLEHALARADFLNAPDMTLVQALTIFLGLVRRHDSPRFVWMMTGLVVRMAQYLGLQRDGSHFKHLTPFEIESRRKVWWAVCLLDMRSSEDQGTDLTIANGSFDTKIPLNINDADISPESTEIPTERDGVTDMSFARTSIGLYETIKQMMASSAAGGVAGLEDQSRRVSEIYKGYEEGYLKHAPEKGNIIYWVAVNVARLVVAKMTLIGFLPVLFSSPDEHFTDELRIKLLISAIEVAEHNHALNAEQACRQWRWVYQTYTHWHAIVFLMIEISRRPWSTIVERAWVALHSSWLIPAKPSKDSNLRIWIPLRKLMAKNRRHRAAELQRLRADPHAAEKLDSEDQKLPLPSSSSLFSIETKVDVFREKWRRLVSLPPLSGDGVHVPEAPNVTPADFSLQQIFPTQSAGRPDSHYGPSNMSLDMTVEPGDLGASSQYKSQMSQSTHHQNTQSHIIMPAPGESVSGQTDGSAHIPHPIPPADWSADQSMGFGSVPWLWADADISSGVFPDLDMDSIDINMDLDGGDMDWYNWVQSVAGIESDARFNGNTGV